MASFAITLVLLLAVAIKAPMRQWGVRLFGRRRAPGRRRSTGLAVAHLPPGLRRLLRRGREALAAIEVLIPLGAEYRRTLPYVSLFFVERGAAPHVRRDAWVVRTREDFERGVGEVARLLHRWRDGLDALTPDERGRVDAADSDLAVVCSLLDDGARLPRSWAEARRFRFSEDPEAEQLLVDLERVGAALRGLQAMLLSTHGGPYRGAGLRG